MNRRILCSVLFLVAASLPAAADDAGYLGVMLGQLPDSVPAPAGVWIQEIAQGSPADRDGLRSGDVILTVNDQTVTDAAAMLEIMKPLKAGDGVRFRLQRAGDQQPAEVTVTLAERPGTPASEIVLRKRPSLGIAFSVLPDGQLSVAQFQPESAAEKAGAKVGDVMKSVSGRLTTDYVTLLSILAAQKEGDEVKLEVSRNGQTTELAVTLRAITPPSVTK